MTQLIHDTPKTTRRASDHDSLLKNAKPYALADGQETYEMPTAHAVSEVEVNSVIKSTRGLEPLAEIEKVMMQYRAACEALAQAAEGADGVIEFKANLEKQADVAERLHEAHLSEVLTKTLPLEKLAREHASFFDEAKIRPGDTKARWRIKLLAMDVEDLLASPRFGTEILPPLKSLANVHLDAVGYVVPCGTIARNEQLVTLGRVGGDHGTFMYLNISGPALNNLKAICKDKDGEENAVLTCVPIRARRKSRYENEDVFIDGNFVAAGQDHDAQTRGIINPRGNKRKHVVSDAYSVQSDPGPFGIDFSKAYDQMPLNVIVGSGATDTLDHARTNYNLYGNLPARGRDSISTRAALFDLRRNLKVQGHRLLAQGSQRAKELRELEKELRYEFVGLDKPFAGLDLSEDQTSAEGKRTLNAGGALIRATVTVNKVPNYIDIVIMPPPAAAPVVN